MLTFISRYAIIDQAPPLAGHHAQTNVDGKDPDLQHFQHLDPDKAPGYRLSKQQPWVPKYANYLAAMLFQARPLSPSISPSIPPPPPLTHLLCRSAAAL